MVNSFIATVILVFFITFGSLAAQPGQGGSEESQVERLASLNVMLQEAKRLGLFADLPQLIANAQHTGSEEQIRERIRQIVSDLAGLRRIGTEGGTYRATPDVPVGFASAPIDEVHILARRVSLMAELAALMVVPDPKRLVSPRTSNLTQAFGQVGSEAADWITALAFIATDAYLWKLLRVIPSASDGPGYVLILGAAVVQLLYLASSAESQDPRFPHRIMLRQLGTLLGAILALPAVALRSLATRISNRSSNGDRVNIALDRMELLGLVTSAERPTMRKIILASARRIDGPADCIRLLLPAVSLGPPRTQGQGI